MTEKDEPLRPRFKINKNRIRSDKIENAQSGDFEPDKVIYVEIDDEITFVFDRVKRVRGDKIALVIPKRAVVLQSIINLRILKKKLDELGKQIVMVTSDSAGLQIAEKVGIATVERLFDKELEAKPMDKLAPLVGQRPFRIQGNKVSISEVIRKAKTEFFLSLLDRLRKRFRKKKQSETHFVLIAPNKQALFTLILVSVLLLLAIAYIALPGATIYLTPRSSILDPAFNVTFMDYEKNRSTIDSDSSNTIAIATFAVNPPKFTKIFKRNATGKSFQGQNARGIITVVNLSPSPWDLAERTRFQTDNGLVFRTPVTIRIPAANAAAPGTLDVSVVADEFDVNNQPIGERGNIPATRFFLPGLKNEENRQKLYGESKSPMAGGVTRVIKSVSKEDLDAARDAVKKEAVKGAADDLKKYLEEQNLIKKTNLSLLTDKNVIKISDPAVIVPADLLGKVTDQFDVTAEYTAGGIAFDRQELVNAIKARLLNRADPDKKIMSVNENDLSYRYLDEDANAGRVRLTVTMRAIQVYELDPENENGQRFLKKITDHILGMSANDAIAYIQQQTEEISNVEITLWPIWAPTVPNIADNIKFVVKDDKNML